MIKFIDANCMVGQRVNPREGSLGSTDDILEVMDNCGIEKAVCYHSVARECDLMLGNFALNKEIKDSEKMQKQWIVMPNIWDEFVDADALIKEMKTNDVKTVRVLPRDMGFSLMPHSSKKLINTLVEHNIPIFIEKSQIDAKTLYEILKAYPKAKFVLCDAGYRCVREVIPIMESCDNLYMETSSFVVHCGVEQFCKSIGADRMIFGTGIPNGSAAAAVSLIRYANISNEEKQKIATGNISRLMGEVVL